MKRGTRARLQGGDRCRNGDGRKEYRDSGICQACYYARPRQLAPPGEGGQLGAVRVRASLIKAMETAARAEGVSLSTWRRRAYELRLASKGQVLVRARRGHAAQLHAVAAAAEAQGFEVRWVSTSSFTVAPASISISLEMGASRE